MSEETGQKRTRYFCVSHIVQVPLDFDGDVEDRLEYMFYNRGGDFEEVYIGAEPISYDYALTLSVRHKAKKA